MGLMVGLILLIGSTTILSQNDDEDCPFTNGSCPVTLDNVVDVFFHDIADRISCQRECRLIDECKFFTMYGVNDDPTDHMKCLLFKTCDHLEACDDCITGPELPFIDDSNCTNTDGNFTCETALDNVVDVFYFDAVDIPQPHHKCFLFKECDIHEPCSTCETGSK